MGRAIANEEAIYFVTAFEPASQAALLTGRMMKRLSGDSGPFQTPLSDLPDAVTEDPSWPVETKEGFVCVFDQKTVSDIRCSWTEKFQITDPNHSALIKTGIIERFRLLRILRNFGWKI